MKLNEFLTTALEKSLEIQYKKEQIGTLEGEIKRLEKELSVLFVSQENKEEIDGSLYLDKESGQMFVFNIDNRKPSYPLTFTTVKPINFSSCHIVDEIDI